MPIRFGRFSEGVRRAVRAGAIGFGAAKRFFGATRATVRKLIGQAFGWLVDAEVNTTEGLSEAAFQAGKSFGPIAGDLEDQLTTLPVINELPESSALGARYEFDLNVSFSGLTGNRRIVVVGESGLTAEEILEQILGVAEERIKQSGEYKDGGFLQGAEQLGDITNIDIVSAARRF